MKADLTRNTFNPGKHFARVLMQQGRVQLDADGNEQTAILLHYLQALAADVIGPRGGPSDNCGFMISPLAASKPVLNDFRISSGRYYVDGLLCELDAAPTAVATASATQPKQVVVASWTVDGLEFGKNQYVELSNAKTPPQVVVAQVVDADRATNTLTLDTDISALKPSSLRRVVSYLSQPDFAAGATALAVGSYLAYLDVWERTVTYAQDDSIREVALNGADTAARSKVVCQVKVMPPNAAVPDPTTLIDPANRGYLRARSIKSAASADPCTISPNARYRGPENQLYRVEIHTGSLDAAGGKTTPTFKWSRENGSVVFPIARSSGANTFVLESLGRDDRFGLAEGDWVEIQDDDSILLNRAEKLLQVQSIDRPTLTVRLSAAVGSTTGRSPEKHPLLRRWDQKAGDPVKGGLELGPDNAALIVEGDTWIEVESGVQIQFQCAVAGQPDSIYRTSDYWTIPARVATGDVEWPTESPVDRQSDPSPSPVALPPEGVTHHYAPLADLKVDASAVRITKALSRVFNPLP
ncbi:MAG TPA: DUF6519 domain-containing protein [Vicinamibacterales bacterium]|jgi:hypothetical protein|nr:DUF6519 domain-containing protein [Vicinamibacterales bacterium]